MNDLAIYGYSGFARETHQIIEDINACNPVWNFLGFIDYRPEPENSSIHGYPVLGNDAWLTKFSNTYVVIAIGSPVIRRKVALNLKGLGHQRFATLIHPRAWVGNRVHVGVGSIIHAGAAVPTDITLGNYVILNKNCSIGHDVEIGDFVFVGPGAIVGAKTVGEGSYLGANSSVLNYQHIGEWSIIGAGSVVLQDVIPNVTVVGAPARIVETRPEGWQNA